MRKGSAVFLAVLMVLGASSAFAKTYKVGCLFSITGKASWLGEPQKNTVEMIVEEINNNGGINGNPIKIFMEDTQGDNSRAVNAAKKLIKKNNVCAIIGPSRSGTTMAVIDVVQKMEVPLLSCAASETIARPVAERKWVFKLGQNDSDAVRKIYDHMAANKIDRIGIITGTTGFGNAGRSQLKELAETYKINIVADETYSPADTDMTAQLLRIRNAGAMAVVNWSIVPAQSIIPKNMKQLQFTIPLYQSHGFANVKYAEAAGDAAEGLMFPSGRLMAVDSLPDGHPQKALLKEYKTRYEKRFNDHVSTFGGHGYDGIMLVVAALKAVGDDPARIRDYIESADYIGTGGHFRFSGSDHCGLDKDAFEMLTVKDGKFVVLTP